VVNPAGHQVEWVSDRRAAQWILDRVRRVDHDLGGTVASLVPEGFAAYVRVLHPAWRSEGPRRVKVRWADLAHDRGTELHAVTQFEDLVADGLSMSNVAAPLVGSLELDELDALVQLLADCTSSPQSCSFAIWEGYGWMRGSPAVAQLPSIAELAGRRPEPTASAIPSPAPTVPRLIINGRALVVYRGSIDDAKAFCSAPADQSPNLWWPHDRAWCVASEIDFSSTYVGGSDDLAAKLLEDERLEAMRVDEADRVTD
jgi:hypothetical protein